LIGDEQDQLKISAPFPLRETYPLIPLSAKQILLESPFKVAEKICFKTYGFEGK
jgi:hypothetical protein